MIDGTELARTRQLSHQLAIDDCVEFTGRISDAALRLAINVGVRPRFVGICETREAKR
jgi:hypothetical protein